MFFHFFKSFSDAAKCNLNIKAEGKNEHHKIEAIFKALARAIKMAMVPQDVPVAKAITADIRKVNTGSHAGETRPRIRLTT